MAATFMIYGATGYVGNAAAHMAVQAGLRPVIAGRNAAKLEALAAELKVECRVFGLEDPAAIDQALKGVSVVLHCAGPYINTSKPMVEACLRSGVHYLDLTGEIPVYQALAARDAEAKARGIMLLPGVGFDVVPTDCLAVHLKQRLPSATNLALAFQSIGPGGMPPGTQRTMIEMLPFGNFMRRNGRLEVSDAAPKVRQVDFGQGPVQATQLTWGDVFTAFYSTGIPNIEVYVVLPAATLRQMTMLLSLRPLAKWAPLRKLLQRGVKPGPTAEERAQTSMQVWGEVQDNQGRKAAAILRGPEATVVWTIRAAFAVVKQVLALRAPAGYQTPALAYGADLVLECEGVTREDLN